MCKRKFSGRRVDAEETYMAAWYYLIENLELIFFTGEISRVKKEKLKIKKIVNEVILESFRRQKWEKIK